MRRLPAPPLISNVHDAKSKKDGPARPEAGQMRQESLTCSAHEYGLPCGGLSTHPPAEGGGGGLPTGQRPQD